MAVLMARGGGAPADESHRGFGGGWSGQKHFSRLQGVRTNTPVPELGRKAEGSGPEPRHGAGRSVEDGIQNRRALARPDSVDAARGFRRHSDPDDRRLRYPVYAFSGARPSCHLKGAKSVAFDLTALITLEFLNLLDPALDFFPSVVIAPSTLNALFLERQRLRHSQPSRNEKAKRILDLISSGRLRVAGSATPMPEAIAKGVDSGLATMLALATGSHDRVVRSAPVTRLGTMLEEEVDMAPFSSRLTDTIAVHDFLVAQGRIDASCSDSASRYLQRVDRRWSSPLAVSEDAFLYLDDLTVTYLDHTGLGPR